MYRSLLVTHFNTIVLKLMKVHNTTHTHHTMSVDTGLTGLTDVAGLGATVWSITIAYVSFRAGTYGEDGTLKT